MSCLASRVCSSALIVSCALAHLFAAPAGASATRLPCHSPHPLVKTAKVLVYDNEFEGVTYACARPNGRSYVLGNGVPGVNGSDTTLATGPQVAGRYATAVFESGLLAIGACERYMGSRFYQCGPGTFKLNAVDVRSGQSARLQVLPCTSPISLPGSPPTRSYECMTSVPLAISRAGAVAWIDDRGLVAARFHPRGKRLNGRVTVLDPSASGLVSLTGLTVKWYDIVNGTRVNHSANLS